MDIEEAIKEIEEIRNFGTSGIVPRWELIEVVLNELDKDNNIISDLQNEVTLKQCELDNKDKQILKEKIERQMSEEADKKILELKDKIINEMAKWIEKHTGYDIDETLYKESKEYIIDYFTKKVEGK